MGLPHVNIALLNSFQNGWERFVVAIRAAHKWDSVRRPHAYIMACTLPGLFGNVDREHDWDALARLT